MAVIMIAFGGKEFSGKGWLLLLLTHTLISGVIDDDDGTEVTVEVNKIEQVDTTQAPLSKSFVTDTGTTVTWDDEDDMKWD